MLSVTRGDALARALRGGLEMPIPGLFVCRRGPGYATKIDRPGVGQTSAVDFQRLRAFYIDLLHIYNN
jgi:hypothetical protein